MAVESSPLRHRPTVIGLAAFALLVAVTAGVMGYRLLAVDGHYIDRGLSAAPTTTAPAPTTPVPTTPPVGNTVTISGVGDIIMGSANIGLPPNNAAGFFDQVKDSLQADVVTGNLEGTLTGDTGYQKCPPEPTPTAAPTPSAAPTAEPKQTCFAFRMPPEYAKRLAEAGFNVINLANNHTNDFGPTGLKNTQQSLKNAGVDYTGMPNQIPIKEVNGIKVAVLGFGPYGWMQRVTDIPAARTLVREASEQADIVVVHMQAGAEGHDRQHVTPGKEEFLGENRGDVMAFSHAVVDAGADIVIGHGPHVLRGAEWYKGRLIAYSVGNFAGYKTLSRDYPSGTGAIVKVTVKKDGTFVAGSFIPTLMVTPGLPSIDPSGSAITQINQLSAADFGSAGAQLLADGAIAGQK